MLHLKCNKFPRPGINGEDVWELTLQNPKSANGRPLDMLIPLSLADMKDIRDGLDKEIQKEEAAVDGSA